MKKIAVVLLLVATVGAYAQSRVTVENAITRPVPVTNVDNVITHNSFIKVLSGDTNVVVQLTTTNTNVRWLTLFPYSNYLANAGSVWVGVKTNGPFVLLTTNTGSISFSAPLHYMFNLTNIYLRSEVTNLAVNAIYGVQ